LDYEGVCTIIVAVF